jgi:amidohydrolase
MPVDPEVTALLPDVVADRRHLHAHPERSFEERETRAYLAKRIAELGVRAEEVGGGLVVRLRGEGGAGRTVAVRADMDGLPIEEAGDLPFRSQTPGVMHACGHDAHMAIVLGVLRLFARRRATLRGEVRFLFQPAEETPPGGAVELIRGGALADVQAVLGLHVQAQLEVGKAQVQAGPLMANSDVFTVAIEGVGGHGSQPHLTVDPVVVMAQTVANLQTIVSRRMDPHAAVVVTVGEAHAGTAHNIIPQRARLGGTVRTFTPEDRGRVRAEMERIVRHTAEAAGARADLTYTEGYPAVVNPDGPTTAAVADAAAEVLGAAGVVRGPAWMAGEDFAYYQGVTAGTFFFLGAGGPGAAPHHSAAFTVDEACLPYGVDILARALARLTAAGD